MNIGGITRKWESHEILKGQMGMRMGMNMGILSRMKWDYLSGLQRRCTTVGLIFCFFVTMRFSCLSVELS